MGWYTAGIKTNPVANTILADTGPAGADTQGDVRIVGGCTVAALVFVEHRDVDGVTVLHSQGIFLPASAMQTPEIIIDVLAGQHIVVRTNAAIAGSTQVSLFSNII